RNRREARLSSFRRGRHLLPGAANSRARASEQADRHAGAAESGPLHRPQDRAVPDSRILDRCRPSSRLGSGGARPRRRTRCFQSGHGLSRGMTIREYLRMARLMGLRARHELTLLGLTLLAALFEGAGLSLLLPIAQFVQNGGDVAALAADSELWKFLIAAFETIHVSVTLPILIATCFAAIVVRQAFAYLRQCYLVRLIED